MAQQIINDGESGLIVRNKLNQNFTEVYGFGAVGDAGVIQFSSGGQQMAANANLNWDNTLEQLNIGKGGLFIKNDLSTFGVIFKTDPLAMTASYNLIMPLAQAPGPNFILQNDGTGNLDWIPTPTGGGGSVAQFVLAFDSSKLTAGILPVPHSLGNLYNQVTIYDENNRKIMSDEATIVDANNINVDLTNLSVSAVVDSWHIVVTGGT